MVVIFTVLCFPKLLSLEESYHRTFEDLKVILTELYQLDSTEYNSIDYLEDTRVHLKMEDVRIFLKPSSTTKK